MFVSCTYVYRFSSQRNSHRQVATGMPLFLQLSRNDCSKTVGQRVLLCAAALDPPPLRASKKTRMANERLNASRDSMVGGLIAIGTPLDVGRAKSAADPS